MIQIDLDLDQLFLQKINNLETESYNYFLHLIYRSTVLAGKARIMSTLVMNSNWRPPAPCQVGDSLREVDTPCMIVDMDVLEENLQLLPRIMQKWPSVAVRVHVKAHKTPALAVLQVKTKCSLLDVRVILIIFRPSKESSGPVVSPSLLSSLETQEPLPPPPFFKTITHLSRVKG